MKKFFVIALMILAGSTLDAQTIISNESLTHDGTDVTVSFDIDTDVKGIPSRRKEVIIPYIYNGKDTVYLDVVEVYGKDVTRESVRSIISQATRIGNLTTTRHSRATYTATGPRPLSKGG